MKKAVSSSNLALRFYKIDGWEPEDIEPYLLKGNLEDTEHMHGDKPEWAYYRLAVYSRLDMDRFYEEKVSAVHRAFNDYPNMTDLEFLKSKNW
jgi:hypothetical protein